MWSGIIPAMLIPICILQNRCFMLHRRGKKIVGEKLCVIAIRWFFFSRDFFATFVTVGIAGGGEEDPRIIGFNGPSFLLSLSFSRRWVLVTLFAQVGRRSSVLSGATSTNPHSTLPCQSTACGGYEQANKKSFLLMLHFNFQKKYKEMCGISRVCRPC